MRKPRAPLFLARAVYRKRRLRDAARLLPILGFLLLLLPLLWGHVAGKGAGRTVVFVFGVWALLIAVSAWLAPGLSRPETDNAEPDSPETAEAKDA